MHSRALSIVALVFALALAGCGEDEAAGGEGEVAASDAAPAPFDDATLKALREAGVKNAEEVVTGLEVPDTPAAEEAIESGAADDADSKPSAADLSDLKDAREQIADAEDQAKKAKRQSRLLARQQRYVECITEADPADAEALRACSERP